MKKINLRGISEILSEKELKNVMGGCDGSCLPWGSCTGQACIINGYIIGTCKLYSFSPWACACYA